MHKLLVAFLLSIFASCSLQQNNFGPTYNNKSFKNRYIDYIEEDESIIESRFHYVKTKTSNGDYILRTFYPETKQMTSEVRCLDRKMEIANGPAKYWHENGHLKSEGDHDGNVAQGEWKYYHRENGQLSSIGVYNDGRKEGVWKNYNSNGVAESEYNYIQDQREGEFIKYDTLGNILSEGTYMADTLFKVTLANPEKEIKRTEEREEREESMPYLSQCKHIQDAYQRGICSNEKLLKFIYSNLRYPSYARDYGIQGMTVTQFTIDKEGAVKDIDVVIGICDGFKEECLKVISKLPQWEPAVQDGKPVDILFTLPIKFKLQ